MRNVPAGTHTCSTPWSSIRDAPGARVGVGGGTVAVAVGGGDVGAGVVGGSVGVGSPAHPTIITISRV
jgi:hypothetical protein